MTELTDLSETDASNTTITTANIAEGCPPSGINNAIRNTLGLIRRAFKASIFRLRDTTDQTKLLAFDLSGITTATTRTVTVPDQNVALGDLTLIVQERQADGTPGGGNTGGSWTQRALSDAITNTIPSATFSAVSDSFTLPAGTYDIFVSAPMYKVNGHRCRLYNLTAAAVSLLGTSAYADSANNVETTSIVDGRVTIAVSSEFIVESRGAATQATNGLGVAANTGDAEIYTTVRVTKVS